LGDKKLVKYAKTTNKKKDADRRSRKVAIQNGGHLKMANQYY
jgi:hypothetical protein